MEPSSDAEPEVVVPMFRNKKRKNIRPRSPSTPESLLLGTQTPNPNDEDDDSVVQDALRLRKKRRPGFPSASSRDPDGNSLAMRDEDGKNQPKGIQDRFMHQTGFVADMDDRHMNAYIEARLRNGVVGDGKDSHNEQPTQPTQSHTASSSITQSRDRKDIPLNVGQPTRQGKLLEVDNLAPLSEPKVKEPRRRRNRRGSDDIKRDQFIDNFLSENRLDVYDVPKQKQQDEISGISADDRLAEEFQRQYMQEAYLRKQRRRPAINQPKGAAAQQNTDEVLKGPKLGGSRNARAAVRDALLSQQDKSKTR